LGGFDPIGLLAGLSFISFLLHALLSFLFRPSAHSAGYYLPHAGAASSRQGETNTAHNLLDTAIDYYVSVQINIFNCILVQFSQINSKKQRVFAWVKLKFQRIVIFAISFLGIDEFA
jgi:hypothetical protein